MTHAPALVRQGRFLFRWRNFLPLPAVLYVIGLQRFGPPVDESLFPLLRAGAAVSASAGLAIRGAVVGRLPPGTSSRSTATMATPLLNTLGPYSVVRHPLYVGNVLMWTGVSMLWELWWLAIINVLLMTLYYERIAFAEEMYLKRTFGETYVVWASRTPAVLPRLSAWRPPEHPFSVHRAVTREYPGVLVITASMFALRALADLRLGVGPFPSTEWILLLEAGVLLYLIGRVYAKLPSLKSAAGRRREGVRRRRSSRVSSIRFGP